MSAWRVTARVLSFDRAVTMCIIATVSALILYLDLPLRLDLSQPLRPTLLTIQEKQVVCRHLTGMPG